MTRARDYFLLRASFCWPTRRDSQSPSSLGSRSSVAFIYSPSRAAHVQRVVGDESGCYLHAPPPRGNAGESENLHHHHHLRRSRLVFKTTTATTDAPPSWRAASWYRRPRPCRSWTSPHLLHLPSVAERRAHRRGTRRENHSHGPTRTGTYSCLTQVPPRTPFSSFSQVSGGEKLMKKNICRPQPFPTYSRCTQGTHNVDVPGTCQYRHSKNHDARLTPFGEQQCEALAARSAHVVAAAQLVGATFILSFIASGRGHHHHQQQSSTLLPASTSIIDELKPPHSILV